MSDATRSLSSLVPERRLAPYRRIVGADNEALEAFYIWSQEVSLSLFRDIAALEVALRSAMARELVSEFSIDWYSRDDLFDDDLARSTRSSVWLAISHLTLAPGSSRTQASSASSPIARWTRRC